jgi:micrococcal nuclease
MAAGLALALLATAVAAADCPRGLLEGEVTYVADGDAVDFGPIAIRLNGLAAPEAGKPGSQEATAAMREMVLRKVVMCELDGEATHDRCAAICCLEGADIAEELVLMGLTRDCIRYSKGRYREAELRTTRQGATISEMYRLPGYCIGRCF